jgi:hypothetical protein
MIQEKMLCWNPSSAASPLSYVLEQTDYAQLNSPTMQKHRKASIRGTSPAHNNHTGAKEADHHAFQRSHTAQQAGCNGPEGGHLPSKRSSAATRGMRRRVPGGAAPRPTIQVHPVQPKQSKFEFKPYTLKESPGFDLGKASRKAGRLHSQDCC